jgi:hypothetical protein
VLASGRAIPGLSGARVTIGSANVMFVLVASGMRGGFPIPSQKGTFFIVAILFELGRC